MAFFVEVTADIYKKKFNIRLEFPAAPTMEALTVSTESNFDTTSRICRPAGIPSVPFHVKHFQVYDDVEQSLVKLTSTSQLFSGCRLYAFQRGDNGSKALLFSDVQAEARRGMGSAASVALVDPKSNLYGSRSLSVTLLSRGEGSSRSASKVADSGMKPASMSMKLRVVFFEIDSEKKGYFVYSDLRDAFIRRGMDHSHGIVDGLFQEADRDKDGRVTYDEWLDFAVNRPVIIDSLYDKPSSMKTEHGTAPDEASIRRANREAEIARLKAEIEEKTMEAAFTPRRAEIVNIIPVVAKPVDESFLRAREAEIARSAEAAAATAELARVQREFEASISRSRVDAAQVSSLARTRGDASVAERSRVEDEYRAAKLEASLAQSRAEAAAAREAELLRSLSREGTVQRPASRSPSTSRRYL